MTKIDYYDLRTSIQKVDRPKRPKLRGSSQNRYGGHQTQKLKPLKGSTFGPANEGRSLSPEEIANQEASRELGLVIYGMRTPL
jgi:hypothetical protein